MKFAIISIRARPAERPFRAGCQVLQYQVRWNLQAALPGGMRALKVALALLSWHACVDAFSVNPFGAVQKEARYRSTTLCRGGARGLTSAASPDGDLRTHKVFDSDAAVGAYICTRVEAIARESIANKGGFSLSIGSGTTVKPLVGLKDTDIDFTKVHVFFGNERVLGDTAYKCYSGAAFADACSIPREQVYKVTDGGAGGAADAALEYEARIKSLPETVVGACARTGLPALDLVLLGSGADGHCASLYPDSPQVEFFKVGSKVSCENWH